MKKLVILVLWIMMAVLMNAEGIIMNQLSRPDRVLADEKDIVIADGISIFIYSRDDFKLRCKIESKAGEGPKEFVLSRAPWIPSIKLFLLPDMIFVNNSIKNATFDRNGKFLLEFKPSIPGITFIPIREKYVIISFAVQDKTFFITYSLYNRNQKLEKELIRIKAPDQDGKKIDPIVAGLSKRFLYLEVFGDKVFIPDDKGVIHVFNETGMNTATIRPSYQPVPISPADIDRFDRFFREDFRFKDVYTMQRDRVEYAKYFPLIKEYRVTRDYVYIITNKKSGDRFETFIFDHQGKLVKETSLSIMEADPLEFFPFAIYDNRIYQLTENESEETWHLKATEIK